MPQAVTAESFNRFLPANQGAPARELLATVAIPVLNGMPLLAEVLAAVHAQTDVPEFEILIVDSGSTDGSLETAARYGARILSIPKSEFNHGDTRNLLVREARGKYVCFLTQDATPASPRWLASMLKPMQHDQRIVAVTGLHIARPNHNPFVKRDIEFHFRGFGIEEGFLAHALKDTKKLPEGLLTFYSDVNAALNKQYWESHPYPRIDYCEDQLFGREVINSGFYKAYSADGAVYHSHDYALNDFLRRYFDEYRGLKNSLNYVDPVRPRNLLWQSLKGWLAEVHYIRRQGYGLGRTFYWSHHAWWLSFFRRFGAILGAAHAELPAPLLHYLSLEKRDRSIGTMPAIALMVFYFCKKFLAKFVRGTAKAFRALIDQGPALFFKKIFFFLRLGFNREPERIKPSEHMKQRYLYNFVLDYDGHTEFVERPLPTGALRINWLIPDFSVGSGGHMTIFRTIDALQRRGHHNHIYLMPPSQWLSSDAALKCIRQNFIECAGVELHLGLRDLADSDVCMATSWHTAYPLYQVKNTNKKIYFVQDHEPEFFATGAESLMAEQTYAMKYKCITAGQWLKHLMRTKYGLVAGAFELAYDHNIYTRRANVPRRTDSIIYYARPPTPRRGFELGALALKLVCERLNNVEIGLFGWDCAKLDLPFPFTNYGILDHYMLSQLYNRATLGLVFSLTNYSLLPREMIACGLPVVDIRGENTEHVYTNQEVVLAEPNPHALADTVVDLMRDASRRDALAEHARRHNLSCTWENQFSTVERLIREL